MKILIVGDDVLGTKLFRVVLEGAGYEVFSAEDGMKGLLFLDGAESIDLIISDLNMPFINGFTFLMMLRKDPRHHSTPCIIHTACFTEYSHERLALDLGANRYLRKSGNMKDILQTVDELIPA